ncbi:oligoendopeptidase F [Bacillus sp. CGMCC 1.16607]|uniref:oligoendopeptidase F n=1 Tax=Bacillus sp. CGMCC 1.16607 TaxID=3351842 RepID=UPI00362DCF16
MKVLLRNQIDEQYQWNLGDIYPSIEEWEDDYQITSEKIDQISKFEGTIAKGPDFLLGYLQLMTEINLIQERLLVYAKFLHDENTKDTQRQELLQRLQPLEVKYSKAISFFIPELLELDSETLESYYLKAELLFFKKFLDNILRAKPHQLSKEQEILLSQTNLLYSADHTFTMLDNADITFEPVIDENGNTLTLTSSTFGKLVASENREVRKSAFFNTYKSYGSLINTISSTYLGNVKKDLFYSQVRNYQSSLEQALFENNVQVQVYSNLVDTIKANQHLMHRYITIRKKALKLQELHMYDIYAPLVPNANQDIPYEEAYDMMLDGLSILGEEYITILKEARTNRWIDVFTNEGKMSGAYQWGTYGIHPYVLLNHRNDLDSLFTLSHEMGHALHSYYSDRENPYLYAQYVIFVAEVASTVNEVLLMYHMLNKTNDPAMKKNLINYFLELFKGKMFRQTMFAEYEKVIHEKVQNEEPLTSTHFSDIYYKLNQEYYGNDIIHDEEIRFEWARIPHFYRSFYVYQYATGFAAAIAIGKRIMEEGNPAVQDYLNFLKSGGTDAPIELLKIAGVDMTSPKPIQDAMDVFEKLMNEFEDLLD